MTRDEIKTLVKDCVTALNNAKNASIKITAIKEGTDKVTFRLELKDTNIGGCFIRIKDADYEQLTEKADIIKLGQSIMQVIWDNMKDYVNAIKNNGCTIGTLLDVSMKKAGMQKVNIPGLGPIGGVYAETNAPQPTVRDNGDGTYTIIAGGKSVATTNTLSQANQAATQLHNTTPNTTIEVDDAEDDDGEWEVEDEDIDDTEYEIVDTGSVFDSMFRI